jgi:hypothetical protein
MSNGEKKKEEMKKVVSGRSFNGLLMTEKMGDRTVLTAFE